MPAEPVGASQYVEGEIMDIRYARAKFGNAVHGMAVGRGNIKDRLYGAFMELVAVVERDIPPHLLDDYRWVRTELTKKEGKVRGLVDGQLVVGVEGRIGATLKTMRFARAEQIARRICYIADRLDDTASE